MIVRDSATGKTSVRITRLTSPLTLDGRLDETFYETVQSISGFIQMEPDGGEPATEKTEIWLAFDQQNVYLSVRAWESQSERMVVNEMRRDSNNIRQGESLGFGFDTFYDQRNAVQFEINPLGGRTDGQSVNERQYYADWNPVWGLAVGEFENGWTAEVALPFKSLRYGPGREQVWGFQARRINKWKNEVSFLTEVPPSYGMGRGSFSASLFATVIGLEAPPGSNNVEIKPYATANLTLLSRKPGHLFFSNLAVNTYIAKTWSEGVDTDDLSYRAQLDYGGDRYGVQLERLAVGDNFIPDVGYLRRDDIRRNYALFRFSPRPETIESVRKFSSIGSLTYTENGAGRLDTRIVDGEFGIEFESSDRFLLGVNDDYLGRTKPVDQTGSIYRRDRSRRCLAGRGSPIRSRR